MTASDRSPDRVLRAIAIFKFAKAALLVAVGLGALRLLDPTVASNAQHWLAALAASSDRRVVQRLIALASGLSPGRLEALGIGAFFYATLFTTEGVGLWRGARWAEYLTVIASLSLVPFELVPVLRVVTVPRLVALVVNLAVVAYLIHRLLRARHVEQPAIPDPVP